LSTPVDAPYKVGQRKARQALQPRLLASGITVFFGINEAKRQLRSVKGSTIRQAKQEAWDKLRSMYREHAKATAKKHTKAAEGTS